MYAAGRLESKNILEYETAARYATDYPQFIPALLDMARVEAEHEAYFRSRIEGHPWTRFFHLWKLPRFSASV
jgi:hypothetical protein